MRVYTGAKKKRTATPVSRRMRAVAFRHQKYKALRKDAEEVLSQLPKITEEAAVETPVITEPVIEEPVIAESVIEEKQPAEEVPQEKTPEEPEVPANVEEEKPEEVSKPKETPEERKARKKAEKERRREEDFQAFLNTPRTGFFKKLLLPVLAIEKEALSKERVTEPMFSLAVNVYKYIAIAAWMSCIVAGFINTNPFGFARIIFSDGAWLAVRLAAYMLCAQYVFAFVLGLASFVLHQPVSWKKYIASMSQSSLFTGTVFVIAALLYQMNPVFGAGLGIAGAVTGCFLMMKAVAKHFDLTKHLRMLVVLVVLCVFAVFGLKYIQAVCGDIYHILKTIMNI